MGYAECRLGMASRTGSASSRTGSSFDVRGPRLKSSSFCPHPSNKVSQAMVKDHMLSHYKRIYSAKAVIDSSLPKSLIHNVKYNDQIRQGARKGGRPHSALSLSQRHSRASCSSAQSTSSLQNEDNPYICSRSSRVSSPRFKTSFHVKDIVYPVYKGDSSRAASEMKYRSPEATAHRKQSVCSLGASRLQSCFKTFQDPVQKTYSGDLLQKHSQHFTHSKPFTPKTLKSDKASYLSKYHYYRSPQRSMSQDFTGSRSQEHETQNISTKNKHMQEFHETSQEYRTEQEWSEDEFNGTYFSASRQQTPTLNAKMVSSDGGQSAIMKQVTAEEEELIYLEFLSTVTEDILSRGFISDGVLDRVIKRHIDMNRHHLDEAKMRHLLEVLRQDFKEPMTMSFSSADLSDSLLPQLESGLSKRTEEYLFPCVSRSKHCDSSNIDAVPLMNSTPLCSPGRTASRLTTEEGDNQEQGFPGFSEHVSSNEEKEDELLTATGDVARNDEDAFDHNQNTTDSQEEELSQDQDEAGSEKQSKEVEDLGGRLSESLHVTSSNHTGIDEEQHTDTMSSLSDDEF